MSGIKSFFKASVPFLAIGAEMAGGPFGTLAASVLTKATGQEVKPNAISDVLQRLTQTPEGMLQLKQAEQDYQFKCKELGFDNQEKMEQAANEDRDSARKREIAVKDITPRVLAYLIVILTAVVSCSIVFGWSPVMKDTTSATLVGAIFGYLFAEVKQVYSYYFGSSSGSDRKTELLAQAPAITEQ